MIKYSLIEIVAIHKLEKSMSTKGRIAFIVNVDWFFLSHRLPIAIAAQKLGYEVHIACGLTNKKETLLGYGFIVHDIPVIRGGASILADLRLLVSIVSVLKEIKPDIVHLITIKPMIFGGIAARLIRVHSVVVSVPGLGTVFIADGLLNHIRKRLVLFLYKLALKQKKVVFIFQNKDDQRIFAKAKISKNREVVRIEGSGVSLDIYAYTPENNETKNVVMISRVLKDKGVLEFINAAKIVSDKNVKATFKLIGGLDHHNPTSFCANDIEDWKKSGIIEVLGHCNNIVAHIQSANIVVLPSYREGFPKVLIEAAACGRAVITTDVPGCRDAIIPGVTGLLVPVRDEKSLAAEIQKLIEDDTLRNRYGIAGRKLAEEKYDIGKVVKRHIEIYDSMIESGN